jgi:putative membrane protein
MIRNPKSRKSMIRSLLWLCACFAAWACLPVAIADTSDRDASGDEAFITAAAQAELGEIELSRIAARSAVSPEIRSFAAKMVQEHTASNAELGQIALKENIPAPIAPDSDHMQLRDKLIALRGKNLDKAYMEAMRSDHQNMVDFLTAASATVTSDDLHNFIRKTLPVVRRHLHMAQELKAG